jgi:hypothetical protein
VGRRDANADVLCWILEGKIGRGEDRRCIKCDARFYRLLNPPQPLRITGLLLGTELDSQCAVADPSVDEACAGPDTKKPGQEDSERAGVRVRPAKPTSEVECSEREEAFLKHFLYCRVRMTRPE